MDKENMDRKNKIVKEIYSHGYTEGCKANKNGINQIKSIAKEEMKKYLGREISIIIPKNLVTESEIYEIWHEGLSNGFINGDINAVNEEYANYAYRQHTQSTMQFEEAKIENVAPRRSTIKFEEARIEDVAPRRTQYKPSYQNYSGTNFNQEDKRIITGPSTKNYIVPKKTHKKLIAIIVAAGLVLGGVSLANNLNKTNAQPIQVTTVDRTSSPETTPTDFRESIRVTVNPTQAPVQTQTPRTQNSQEHKYTSITQWYEQEGKNFDSNLEKFFKSENVEGRKYTYAEAMNSQYNIQSLEESTNDEAYKGKNASEIYCMKAMTVEKGTVPLLNFAREVLSDIVQKTTGRNNLVLRQVKNHTTNYETTIMAIDLQNKEVVLKNGVDEFNRYAILQSK